MSTDTTARDLLHLELDQLRREVDRLTAIRDGLAPQSAEPATPAHRSTDARLVNPAESCVFEDDDDDALAFDEFYRAYDEVHVKTRKFLLG